MIPHFIWKHHGTNEVHSPGGSVHILRLDASLQTVVPTVYIVVPTVSDTVKGECPPPPTEITQIKRFSRVYQGSCVLAMVSLVPRPYFQFVGPGSRNLLDSVGVIMETPEASGESSGQV
jgi:hypothetical protein